MSLGSMDKSTLLRMVREAGVVGEGGAGFPAHVKYDTRVETVIANGSECEPLLYSDQYIMSHQAEAIVRGLLTVMSTVAATRGVLAIKRKYREISRELQRAAAGTGLELAYLDNFYPAGDEHILVYEITGRTIPPLGLPKDVGALVANVGTLVSVAQALENKPVTHKVVTVTGEVAQPGILRVPIGTRVAEVIEHCGGTITADPVYILGGPMMGRLVDQTEAMSQEVITKTCGGIIVLPRGHYLHECATLSPRAMQKRAATACIQCRYCTDLCPRYLIGHRFETHQVMRAFAGGVDTAPGALQAFLCCECGLCELFSCPMRLSPRRINALLKVKFREQGLQFPGPREVRSDQTVWRPYRKIPPSRLAIKTDLVKYMDIHPEFVGDFTPASVRIPLKQHTGVPAVAQVQTGTRVQPGDLIGEIPSGALGARVHASMAGLVTQVGDLITIEGT